MAMNFLEFEQPIAELEAKIEELQIPRHRCQRQYLRGDQAPADEEPGADHQHLFQSFALANHAVGAPSAAALYARLRRRMIFTDWHELHGDRMYSDDLAIVGGLARLEGMPVMVIGQQKGRDTKERVRRNYGMPKPEGYRKALRLMRMAERFRIPVITLDRYAGRLSRHRLGGARPERGHRAQSVRDVASRGAGVERGDRRGRLGRRVGHRRVRPAGDAAIQRLLGDLAGELRVDFVEEHRQEGDRRRCHGRHGGAAEEAGFGR